jgi:hypothetical protein
VTARHNSLAHIPQDVEKARILPGETLFCLEKKCNGDSSVKDSGIRQTQFVVY